MNKSPLFSILIANYNNAAYLQACLDSVFAQTYTQWEIVLVDDASSDHSDEIYNTCKDDGRIRIFRNPSNQGVGYTKKKCLDEARGDLLGFLDPDDTLHPEALSTMVAAHAAHPEHSIVYSTHYICDQDLQVSEVAHWVDQIPEKHFSWEFSGRTISAFATFKKTKYDRTEGLSTWFLKAVDKDLYYKLEETGPVLFIPKSLYYYRHHAGSISLQKQVRVATLFEWAAKAEVLIRNKASQAALARMPYKRAELAAGLFMVGIYLMGRGKYKWGQQIIFKAWRFFHWQVFKGLFLMQKRIRKNL